MIQMEIGAVEYGVITPPVMGGIQEKFGFACCRQRERIAGCHRGCSVFIDD
jgi:hypothetical protein